MKLPASMTAWLELASRRWNSGMVDGAVQDDEQPIGRDEDAGGLDWDPR